MGTARGNGSFVRNRARSGNALTAVTNDTTHVTRSGNRAFIYDRGARSARDSARGIAYDTAYVAAASADRRVVGNGGACRTADGARIARDTAHVLRAVNRTGGFARFAVRGAVDGGRGVAHDAARIVEAMRRVAYLTFIRSGGDRALAVTCDTAHVRRSTENLAAIGHAADRGCRVARDTAHVRACRAVRRSSRPRRGNCRAVTDRSADRALRVARHAAYGVRSFYRAAVGHGTRDRACRVTDNTAHVITRAGDRRLIRFASGKDRNRRRNAAEKTAHVIYAGNRCRRFVDQSNGVRPG